ncbi:amidohydrolase [Roseiarcus fermentans]|uniref:Amidohydrolase n=1 Tax=Roseiarcus fermentans TaxID=1473586 RepID=A0A366F4V1_9HYPH|nr:amidohydrolase [Roseiarcus fermentans]RBP09671.1 amidohydrolase [Roseiarcus fermentans]
MLLSGDDLSALAAWRKALHRAPDLSGREEATAREVRRFLAPTRPDRIVTGLGGHGLAFVYQGAGPGPTVLLRAELDALPIEEVSTVAHRSDRPGVAHLCGHDGHMAILAGVARALAAERPKRGRAVLLFQPAEEDGSGAEAVLADPKFSDIAPDFCFALHNMPGLPLGTAALKAGPVACASRGMRLTLTGRTAHASMPGQGVSPMAALAALMPALTALGKGGSLDERFAMVTVTHAEMGARSFGVAPGEAEVWATLRALTDARMERLRAAAEALARRLADAESLATTIGYSDAFAACVNAPAAVARLAAALDAEGVPRGEAGQPMLASEDFGVFGRVAPSALFLLGAGEDRPGLHNPDYDFPDALIGIGARVFLRVLCDLLG